MLTVAYRVYEEHYYNNNVCKSSSLIKFDEIPPKRRPQMEFCTEHRDNTCCSFKDDRALMERFNLLTNSTMYKVSDRCV